MMPLKYSLIALMVSSMTACGSAQTQPSPQIVYQTIPATLVPEQSVVTLQNTGTQDPSLGAAYVASVEFTTVVPTTLIRLQGSTLQDGVGAGVDFGNGLGQCFYNANTESQNVFTLDQCNGGLVAGSELQLQPNQIITLWSYNHVNSDDSVVELVLTGETQ